MGATIPFRCLFVNSLTSLYLPPSKTACFTLGPDKAVTVNSGLELHFPLKIQSSTPLQHLSRRL